MTVAFIFSLYFLLRLLFAQTLSLFGANQANPSKFATHKRIRGMLTCAAEELPNPLYYDLPALIKLVKVATLPKAQVSEKPRRLPIGI